MVLAVCDTVWRELRKLRDIPALETDLDTYRDFAAFAACKEVRASLGRCSDLPREAFLSVFSHLVAGPRLEELFDLFKASRRHPALQYACLVALHGVAELSDRRVDLLTRPDVVRELLAVMASPRRKLVTPASAGVEAAEIVNAAAGAVAAITGLFTSNHTLEPDYAKLWVDLGAVPALASSLEGHAAFDRANPISSDLPLCFFLISTSLLAGSADSVSDKDRLRLGVAWLRLFVEARRWIANEAADLLSDFYVRPNWLKSIVVRIPEELRVRAVGAARECEREFDSWKLGKADQLAMALRCVNVTCEDEKGRPGTRCARPGCVRVQSTSSEKGGGDDGAAGKGGGGREGGDDARFKRCSRCHVLYCSRECQKAHWKAGHRKACSAPRA